MIVDGMNIIDTRFAAGYEPINGSRDNLIVDLYLIKHFFNDKINKLPIPYRIHLSHRFEERAGFPLGAKSIRLTVQSPQTPGEESLACVLFDMYMKWLEEQNYVYMSAAQGYFFAGPDAGMTGGWFAKREKMFGKLGVTLRLYNDVVDGKTHLRAQCSTLANGFLSLLWAFNWPQERLYTHAVAGLDRTSGDHPNNLVTNKPHREVNSINVQGYNGANIMTVGDAKYYYEDSYITLDTNPEVINVITRLGARKPTSKDEETFRQAVKPFLSNSFRLAGDGTLHMIYREPFVNHYCAYISSVQGQPQTQYKFPYFDPLVGLRYKNGHTDLMEGYIFHKHHRLKDGSTVEEFRRNNNARRRFYSIPEAMHTKLKDSLFYYSPFGKTRFTYSIYDAMDRPRGEKPTTNLTLFQWLALRYNPLYIFIDEEDWMKGAVQGHPVKILDFFSGEFALQLDLALGRSKSFVMSKNPPQKGDGTPKPAKPLSRSTSTSDLLSRKKN